MKYVLIFVLATTCSLLAFADQQADSQQMAAPTSDSRLLRMTWEVSSCVLPEDDPSGQPLECSRPAELQRGDRLYLRESTTGNCRAGLHPVVLSFVQDNNQEMNIFFGCIVTDKEDSGRRELAIEFIDDPLGANERHMKTLTIQHVRVAGDQSGLDACKHRVNALSSNRLQRFAEEACLFRPNDSMVHWHLGTNCTLPPGKDECDPDQISSRSPPDDGQGTASGKE